MAASSKTMCVQYPMSLKMLHPSASHVVSINLFSSDTLSTAMAQDAGPYRCQDVSLTTDFLASSGSLPQSSRISKTCREKMCEWAYRIMDFVQEDREAVAVAFSMVDRFLELQPCDRTEFKLATIVSLGIAMKVCSSKQISLCTLSQLTRGEFSKEEIVSMEQRMLSGLKWRVNSPSTQSFIRQLAPFIVAGEDGTVQSQIMIHAIFFAEMSVFGWEFVGTDKFSLSLACVFNAMTTLTCCDIPKLQADFLLKVSTVAGAELDTERISTIQDKLWRLYFSSAQLQHKEILPAATQDPQHSIFSKLLRRERKRSPHSPKGIVDSI